MLEKTEVAIKNG